MMFLTWSPRVQSEVEETVDVTVPDVPAEEEAMIKLLPQEVSQSQVLP